MTRDHDRDAWLLSAWAESLRGDTTEIPEDVLSLLDGTAGAEEAARARARLAEDPDLARAFGAFTAELRSLGDVEAADPPDRLLQDAITRGRPSRRTAPDPRKESAAPWWSRAAEMLRGAPGLSLAAAAAAVLLVVTVVRSPVPPSGEPATVRGGSGRVGVTLTGPPAGADAAGEVTLRWNAVPDAVSYRVVVMDPAGARIVELGTTTETSIVATAAELGAGGTPTPADFHWTVRARLRDGTETVSAPGHFVWTSP